MPPTVRGGNAMMVLDRNDKVPVPWKGCEPDDLALSFCVGVDIFNAVLKYDNILISMRLLNTI